MNLVLIQGCGFEEAALRRGDLSEVEWRTLKVLLPVERKPEKGGRGRPPEDNRNIINSILWRLLPSHKRGFAELYCATLPDTCSVRLSRRALHGSRIAGH